MSQFPSRPALLVFLALLSLFLLGPIPQTVRGQNLPVVGVFSSHYNSSNFTDTTLSAGSIFAVQVNVTNAGLFNGFEFVLYFDQNYIKVQSYDLSSGTVFGSTVYQSPNTYNGPGALRIAAVNLSNGNNNNGFYAGGSGMLANITFSIVAAGGLSPLVLAAGINLPSSTSQPPSALCPQCPPGSPNWTRLIADGNLPDGTALSSKIQVETTNGYFRNLGGNPGPVASFSIKPANPVQGDTVTFNATASFDPDNAAAHNNGIFEYLWDFGDASRDANQTSVFPITTHAFISEAGSDQFLGNFSIRLTVIDSDSASQTGKMFQGMSVRQIAVSRSPQHCVTVETISATGIRYNPGDNVPISIRVKDAGTFPETFNLTVTIGPPNQTLVRHINQNILPSQSISYSENLASANSSRLPQGIYNLGGVVQLAGAQNCRAGANVSQFEINPPSSTSILLLVVGVIVLVPVAALTLNWLRKRMRREPDDL